jgi:hypothetical protein
VYWRLASIGINPPVDCSGAVVNSLHDAGVFAEKRGCNFFFFNILVNRIIFH